MNERFYQSKKFWVFVFTQILSIVLAAIGEVETAATLAPGTAYLVGQGIADINKQVAK